MKYRLRTKTPYPEYQLALRNGSLLKAITWWQFYFDWENVRHLIKLLDDKQQESDTSFSFIENVLKLVGSHATLWLGDYKGIVAPLDITPTGWTYPSGELVPLETWWHWYPDSESATKLLEQANNQEFPYGNSPGIFKELVPFQLQRKHGELLEISSLPLLRLPDLVKKETDWVFEWEDNESNKEIK